MTLLLSLVVVACLVALHNWRGGILSAVLVGLLQEPLRKLVPGAPALLVLANAPIWLCVVVGAANAGQLPVRRFLEAFPKLGRWARLFAAYLVIPAAISATYGHNTWLITLLGLFVYGIMFLMVVAGWQYPDRHTPSNRALLVYGIAAALLLIGGPLEHLGVAQDSPLLGTDVFGYVWVTHRPGDAVYMLSGLFRSPDVMGWHAALVFMVAVILAFRAKGPARWFWIAVAVWGVLNIWLCGRRKMLSMIPVFMACYLLLIFRFRKVQKILTFGALALVIGSLGWHLISAWFYNEAVEKFYVSTLTEAEDQIQRHGINSVIGTTQQAGFWGYGLGMSQQGVRNIPNVETPRLWQESGPSKVVAELGVPGYVLYMILGLVMLITAYHVVRLGHGRPEFFLTAGLFSVLIANIASSVVSAQIFGDPLVAFLLAFLMGLLLSAARPAVAPAPVVPEEGAS